jgi:hypothetical protein
VWVVVVVGWLLGDQIKREGGANDVGLVRARRRNETTLIYMIEIIAILLIKSVGFGKCLSDLYVVSAKPNI